MTYISTLEGEIKFLSSNLIKYFNLDNSFIDENFLNFYVDKSRRDLFLDEIRKTGKISSFNSKFKFINKEYWISVDAKLDLKSNLISGNMRDITSRKELKMDLELYKKIYLNSPTAVVITDKNADILFTNPKFLELSGIDEDKVLSINCSMLKTNLTPRTTYDSLWETISNKKEWEGQFTNRNYLTKEIYYEKAHIFPILDENDEIKYYVAQKSNITKEVKYKQKLEHLAYHDYLTGLKNRKFFYDSFKDRLKLVKEKEDENLILFYLDLNDFKPINDIHGHEYGDEVLRTISKRLQNTFLDSDIISRLGGDEFAILIQNDSRDILRFSKKNQSNY